MLFMDFNNILIALGIFRSLVSPSVLAVLAGFQVPSYPGYHLTQ